MADPGRLDELKRKFEENPKRYFAPLANEYRKAGEADAAIELCRTYLPQQPGHMSGYIVYGQALHDAGQAEEAAAVFKQALTLDPENIIALRQLGDIARDAGDSAGAMRWYGKVLDLDPRNDEVAAHINGIASPGSQPQPVSPERAAPPTIRPEPEPDASAVRLEDIVSAPDTAQLPIMADEPAQHAYEASEQPVEPMSDEPFEVTEWPTAAEGIGGSVGAESGDPSKPLRLSDYMPDEDSAFAPLSDEFGGPEPEPVPEPEVEQPAELATPAPTMTDSPFATATMAELYMQQGLRGEALTIYRQLVIRRDDPAIHARIAELEADAQGLTPGETVRAFFARIGEKRPEARVEAPSADTRTAPASAVAEQTSTLANLFNASAADPGDIAAAKILSGAFGKPQSGIKQS